jgi:hypothetical protein
MGRFIFFQLCLKFQNRTGAFLLTIVILILAPMTSFGARKQCGDMFTLPSTVRHDVNVETWRSEIKKKNTLLAQGYWVLN